MKLPKLSKMKLPEIINNKYILYLTLILSIINVIGFLNAGDNDSVLLFIITGLLSSYFSKNMIVNLGIAMIVANCMFCKKMVLEGFKEGKDDDKSTAASAAETAARALNAAAGNAVNKQEPKGCNPKCDKGEICSNGTCKPSKKKSGFTQRNVPSSKPATANHEEDDSEGERIDYAATLEGAYDNLQKMLGDGGMKGLSSETKRLVDQQKSLMESLNNMAPVLNSAKATLDNLQMPDPSDLKNLIGKLNGGLNQKKK